MCWQIWVSRDKLPVDDLWTFPLCPFECCPLSWPRRHIAKHGWIEKYCILLSAFCNLIVPLSCPCFFFAVSLFVCLFVCVFVVYKPRLILTASCSRSSLVHSCLFSLCLNFMPFCFCYIFLYCLSIVLFLIELNSFYCFLNK